MLVAYDPVLVALSVIIAVSGGYTCFHLAERLTHLQGGKWKATLVAAAVAIGGGIWSMHFVGMLALNIPIAINYDILGTLLSALVAVGITGIALYVVSIREVTGITISLGGILMGMGIIAMHYVGMAAIRANCIISYSTSMVFVSMVVGIGASIMALYFAFKVRSRLQQVPAAVAMGLGISGMHYTAMFAASFMPGQGAVVYAAPALEYSTIAIITTVVAFALFGATSLLAAPVPVRTGGGNWGPWTSPASPGFEEWIVAPASDKSAVSQEHSFPKVPVLENKSTVLLESPSIVFIQADARYTKVCTAGKEYFSNLSISDMENRLNQEGFIRVHRSYIVNLKHVKSFRRNGDQGEVVVDAAGGERFVPVSRTKVGDLKAALGI